MKWIKTLNIKIKIFFLKLEFSDISDDLAAHYFNLAMRKGNKKELEDNLLQYRKRKFQDRRIIVEKITELRRSIEE
jgi:hypothetical protein